MVRNVLVAHGMDAIGEAACMRLALLGYRVAVAYARGNDAAHAWLAEMEQRGYRLQAYACDGADRAAAMQCLTRIQNETGPVDVFVNNAVVPHDAPAGSRQDAGNGINRDTARALADAICDGMTARGWGRIIHILPITMKASAGGQVNSPAAGSDMHGLSNALLPELVKKGVTVNTIVPRHAGKAMASAGPEEVRDHANPPQIPVGRLSMAEEVAGLIAYLASDEAALLTGAHIAINGPQQSS